MMMRVLLHPQVLRYLAKLSVMSPKDRERCVRAIRGLGEDPCHPRPGVDKSPWGGPEFDYRLRVGRHRFGYTIQSDQVLIDDAWLK